MKKLSIFMATVALALGFASCQDDNDPVFQKPTEFVLNTPAMAEQYYELTPDGFVEFTCSQPNYGFTASVNYGVEVSLDQNEWYTLSTVTPTSTVLRVQSKDLATAICVLRGIKAEEDWVEEDARPVYVRATAQIGEHGDSYIQSNTICLQRVKEYFAVPVPGFIYFVGQPSGWVGPDEANADKYTDWRLFEMDDAIGSNVYWACFDIPSGENQAMFRFYTALTGWDGGDSWGYQVDDNATSFDFTDGLELLCDKGKGSYYFPDWEGGEMTICVDIKAKSAIFWKGNQMPGEQTEE